MADLTDVYAALKQADAAGDTASATRLADYIRTQSAPVDLKKSNPSEYDPASPAYQEKYGAVSGNTVGQNFAIGVGQGMHNLYQGAEQAAGLASRQDVADTRALDAPLADAPGAGAGRFVGTSAAILPAAFVPGANTLAGASLIGALSGYMQPSTSTGETVKNTLGGGAGGLGGLLAGRVLGAGLNAARATVQPLFAGGQRDIAATALQSFAGGPQEAATAAAALRSPPNVLPGIQPTTAELANNAGLAQLERQMRNNPEYMTALTQRNQSNRATMTGALDTIAGTDKDMAAAVATRKQWADPLYKQAEQQSAPADQALVDLMDRPSIQTAWRRASKLAQERNEPIALPTKDGVPGINVGEHISGKEIQYIKMGLNDMLQEAEQKGIGSHEQTALKSTLAQLNSWTGKNLTALRDADQTFQAGSSLINQYQVGGALRDKLTPALSDFGNNTRLNANAFAGAVRNGDQLASRMTGQDTTLSGVLGPKQMQTVNQVGQQLARRANADELGRAVGSNTSQNIISQNMLRQMLGPLGLPQSLVERSAQSTFGQSLMRPAQWAVSAGEPRIMGQLADATLDPQKAASLLTQSKNPTITRAIWERQGLAGLTGASIAAYLQQ